MMRNTCISLLLFLSLGFTLLGVDDAGQAEQLKRLIQSKRQRKSDPLGAGETSTPPVFPLYPQEGLQAADHKITALPGQPEGVDFDQYSGYVTVDGGAGRALFYYFAESPSNSSSKPLVLWLNGGPGCSSLGYGAMQELGPFTVKSDGKMLQRNRYAWNKLANVIFLESPAGVGFSYSSTHGESGDRRTAEDAYAFLLNWLERFPLYKSRDFYIAGESYAGHYVPQMAALILRRNQLPNNTRTINLSGIAVGNPYLDDAINMEATFDYFWGHALISNEIYREVRRACNFSLTQGDRKCTRAMDDADSAVGNIDSYNIYAPICLGPNTSTKSGVAMADVDPCSDDYVASYLNSPDVQKALHAKSTRWQACVNLAWNDAPSTVIPLIKQLVSGGSIRVWLYSGDVDTVCPYTGTVMAINAMKLPITQPWRPWYSRNQVGGYVAGYGRLTFVTVRGAGHPVPRYQPQRSLTMLSAFLKGMLPPSA